MKECARDVNIFLFHDNEESRLYINFLTQWEDSWEGKECKATKSIEIKKITNRKMSTKTKTKTCYIAYNDMDSVVGEIIERMRCSMESSNKAVKFEYLVLSVLMKNISTKV